MTSPIALHPLHCDVYKMHYKAFPCSAAGGCKFVTSPKVDGYNYVLVLTPDTFEQVADAIGVTKCQSFAPIHHLNEDDHGHFPESLHALVNRLIPDIDCRMSHLLLCCSLDAERFIAHSTALNMRQLTTKEYSL